MEYIFHENYADFMSEDRIEQLNKIFDQIDEETMTPSKENVLRFLKLDPKNIKVIIMGQDPYFSVNNGQLVANGRAFEPDDLYDWNAKFRQVSLKNIIRLIYRSYKNEIKSYKEIMNEVNAGSFPLLNVKEWFNSLENQGVLLLNGALTTIIGKPNSHKKLWIDFIIDLIKYLDNYDVIWFLWGNEAKKYIPYIHSKYYTSNHPMMCNIKNEQDFLNSNCFIETKNIINWLG